MKRKQEKERYDRLSFKTRDRQFQQEAIINWSGVLENEMGKEEIRIVTGMKSHLIDEYLKNMETHKAAIPP